MQEPHRITVGRKNVGASDIEHGYFTDSSSRSLRGAQALGRFCPEMYGIIFCRTRQETNDIVTKLRQDGYDVDLISGELSQKQRDHVSIVNFVSVSFSCWLLRMLLRD